MKNKTAISYLALCFGAGWLLIAALRYFELALTQDQNIFQQLLVLLLYWIPAFSAFIVIVASNAPLPPLPRLWPVLTGGAIRVVVMTLLVFCIIYGIGWGLGLTAPNWRMTSVMNSLEPMMRQMNQPITPEMREVAPVLLLVSGGILTVVLGILLYPFLLLGQELGWRWFFQPHLENRANWRGWLLTGILWGLWILPFVLIANLNAKALEQFPLDYLRIFLLLVILSIIIGQGLARHGNAGLTTLFVGFLYANATSFWVFLFPGGDRPWTGPTGFIALAAWGAVALAPGLFWGKGHIDSREVVAPETAAPAEPAAE